MLYSLMSLMHSCCLASNVAFGKYYEVRPEANYRLAAPPSDTKLLTDGKYTVGHFWTNKTTVGWQSPGIVEICIDLEKSVAVDTITLNTARRKEADVFYPANIFVFLGKERNKLSYVGDMAVDADNKPGSYQVKKFILRDVKREGRFVLFEIVPKGQYFFCDEIQVEEGTGARPAQETISLNEAREWPSWSHVNALFQELKESDSSPDHSTLRFLQMEKELADKRTTSQQSESAILLLWRDQLAKRFSGKEFIVDIVNPWLPISPLYLPVGNKAKNLFFSMPVGGSACRAISLTNLLKDSVEFRIEKSGFDNYPGALSLSAVPFVKVMENKYVADPLMPLAGKITLRSGETRLVLVSGYGKQRGKWKGTLKITGPRSAISIPMVVEVHLIDISDVSSFSSVNWAYVNRLPDDKYRVQAVKDLKEHRTNVVVVHPDVLPNVANPNQQEFDVLRKHLCLHKSFSKVIMFMGHNVDFLRKKDGIRRFREGEWKNRFKSWYWEMLKTVRGCGFGPSQLYVQPFDEMRGIEVPNFIEFASWARTELAGIQFAATICFPEALPALPYLDIAQLSNSDTLLRDVRRNKGELWLYSGNGKGASPYSSFRLLPWKAFLIGFSGAGFWDYSAFSGWSQHPKPFWDDYALNPNLYSVVYDGGNGTIMSSRRWEAWRLGVEDFELLTLYAKLNGDKTAKDLAKYVLEKPDDTSRADEIRNKILIELSEIRKYDSGIRR